MDAQKIELTVEQRQAVRSSSGIPVRVIDPETNIPYVLFPEELFQKIKSLFDLGPLTEEEKKTIIAGVWKRAHWDDPAMDDYAKLDPANNETR